MLNFCTLFDSHYLSRGLAMHRSLKQHCPDFHLYIFPFDDASFDMLAQLKLEDVTLVRMSEFETEDLLRIKPSRTRGEYCWTCTPSIILHCINTFHLPDCTYVDADLFFYSNPKVLLDELGNNSVLITEHRYTPAYDQSESSGIYCVQFITFRNDKNGITALTWWRDRCLEWCYNRLEDGKFGDQKYLDDWTARFEGVHVLKHPGGGVAPWNVQQYDLRCNDGSYRIANKDEIAVPLVFYHFHWVRFLGNQRVDLGHYDLDFPCVETLYRQYLQSVLSMDELLHRQFQFRLEPGRKSLVEKGRGVLSNIRRKIKGSYNVINLKTYIVSG